MCFLLLQKDSRFQGMTWDDNLSKKGVCHKNTNMNTYTHTNMHTHIFLDSISLTNKSLRPNLQLGQWSTCICRCDPCWILRSVQSTLVHQAKQRPTDIETICDKVSQTNNMTSPRSTNLCTACHPHPHLHPMFLFFLHPPAVVGGGFFF